MERLIWLYKLTTQPKYEICVLIGLCILDMCLVDTKALNRRFESFVMRFIAHKNPLRIIVEHWLPRWISIKLLLLQKAWFGVNVNESNANQSEDKTVGWLVDCLCYTTSGRFCRDVRGWLIGLWNIRPLDPYTPNCYLKTDSNHKFIVHKLIDAIIQNLILWNLAFTNKQYQVLFYNCDSFETYVAKLLNNGINVGERNVFYFAFNNTI